MMNKEVLINGIIKRLKENCELRPSETLVLINYIEDLQQRIDKVNQIIDECLMLMPHEFSWEEQIENIREILGGKE